MLRLRTIGLLILVLFLWGRVSKPSSTIQRLLAARTERKKFMSPEAPPPSRRDRSEMAFPKAEPSTQLRSFPHDAQIVAKKYAKHLHLQEIEEPLTQFLASVATVEGLDGVGLTAYEEADQPFMLAVHILSDLRVNDELDKLSPGTQASKSFAALRRHVNRLEGHPLRITLWHVNTANSSLEGFAASYPNHLQDFLSDEFALGAVAFPGDLAIFRAGVVSRAA